MGGKGRLHALLDRPGDVGKDSVHTALGADPGAATKRDKFDQYPLHRLCNMMKVTPELCRIVLDAYRAAASKPDDDGLYPLHLLCNNTSISVELWHLVYQAHPAAAKQPAKVGGRYPLHCLCANESITLELCRLVVDAHRGAAAERQGHKDRLPLHNLCENPSVSWELCRVVLDAHPAAADQPDKGGVYPLYKQKRITMEDLPTSARARDRSKASAGSSAGGTKRPRGDAAGAGPEQAAGPSPVGVKTKGDRSKASAGSSAGGTKRPRGDAAGAGPEQAAGASPVGVKTKGDRSKASAGSSAGGTKRPRGDAAGAGPEQAAGASPVRVKTEAPAAPQIPGIAPDVGTWGQDIFSVAVICALPERLGKKRGLIGQLKEIANAASISSKAARVHTNTVPNQYDSKYLHTLAEINAYAKDVDAGRERPPVVVHVIAHSNDSDGTFELARAGNPGVPEGGEKLHVTQLRTLFPSEHTHFFLNTCCSWQHKGAELAKRRTPPASIVAYTRDVNDKECLRVATQYYTALQEHGHGPGLVAHFLARAEIRSLRFERKSCERPPANEPALAPTEAQACPDGRRCKCKLVRDLTARDILITWPTDHASGSAAASLEP